MDLVATLQELASLDVGFVSLSGAFDLTTPSLPAHRERSSALCCIKRAVIPRFGLGLVKL